MAEINVQRKRRSLWWLWLLVILIVAAVVYYLYINNYFDTESLNAMNHSYAEFLTTTRLHFS